MSNYPQHLESPDARVCLTAAVLLKGEYPHTAERLYDLAAKLQGQWLKEQRDGL